MIPDKIYIGTVTLSSNAPSEEYLLPDWHLRPNPKVANTEYIRKDALLELIKEESKFWNDGEMIFRGLIDKLNSM